MIGNIQQMVFYCGIEVYMRINYHLLVFIENNELC